MKYGTKKFLGVALASAMGIAGYMMYKRNNPDMVEDMTKAAKSLAHEAAHKLEDMD